MLASAVVLEIDPTQVWVVDHPELQVRLQNSTNGTRAAQERLVDG
jgi:hypothetical protein